MTRSPRQIRSTVHIPPRRYRADRQAITMLEIRSPSSVKVMSPSPLKPFPFTAMRT